MKQATCLSVPNLVKRFALSLLLFTALLFSGLRPACAQATAGLAEISGIVRDPSGAVVPDAQVKVSNPSKGIDLTLNTSAGGVFDAPSLVPAAGYSVTVDKQGFSQYQAKDLDLSVGRIINLDVNLAVGTTAVQVTVVGTPIVDNTKTDVSQVVDSQQILDLPINGRRVDSFVLLAPGVTNDGNYGLLTFRGVANGNTFLLDGNDSTEQFYGENNGRTRITSQISQDAVQEFQVVSANFSAEYGRAMGGVVNTVTRSGTDNFHGTLYSFYRNQDMFARDPFASVKPNEWRLQSGASLGGPIVKDKLFFFVNTEFTRRNFPLVDSYVKAGIVDSTNEVFLGCGAPATPAQCAAVNTLLPRFFGQVPRTVDQDLVFGRLDYHLSDRNTFSASFNYMHFKAPNGLQQTLISSTTGAGVNSNGNDFGRVRNGRATWTWVPTSSFVNQVRYGWDTDLEGDTLNPALNGSLGLLDVSAAAVTLGAVNYLPRIEPNEARNEVGDDASWTRGRHVVKFGTDIATTNDFSIFIQNLNGNYTYQTVTAFAQDFTGNTTGAKHWQSYTQSFGNPALNTRINDFDFYLQDQWKVTNKFTATLGARYEYSQLPQPRICNPAFTQTCHINSQNTNLMPRIGLAYALNDKTVVRGGFGTFYARVMGATLQDLFTGNGVNTTSISLASTQAPQLAAGPVFPNILSAVPSTGLSTVNVQFVSPNWKTPYSEQAILGVDREITKDLAVTVSYIWSRGIQLYSERDLNLPTATTNYTYTIGDANGNPVGTYTTPVLIGKRPNANWGGVYEADNGVTSFYDALTFQITKRFSHGLQAQASYTWSHEIDDGQGYGQDTQNIYLSNANAWLVNGDYKLDKGDGLEDQPQRFVFSWIWSPTFVHRDGAFYKYAVNNWQLSSITTINSARPYGNPTIKVNDTPVTGMFSNFTINGSGLSSRVPFLPENNVWQPALYRDDLRLTKIFPITERYTAYLNLEAFNISNTWSPTSMTTQAYTEAKGVLTLTPTAFNLGSGDAYPPDGTEARRLQVSARFSF